MISTGRPSARVGQRGTRGRARRAIVVSVRRRRRNAPRQRAAQGPEGPEGRPWCLTGERPGPSGRVGVHRASPPRGKRGRQDAEKRREARVLGRQALPQVHRAARPTVGAGGAGFVRRHREPVRQFLSRDAVRRGGGGVEGRAVRARAAGPRRRRPGAAARRRPEGGHPVHALGRGREDLGRKSAADEAAPSLPRLRYGAGRRARLLIVPRRPRAHGLFQRPSRHRRDIVATSSQS